MSRASAAEPPPRANPAPPAELDRKPARSLGALFGVVDDLEQRTATGGGQPRGQISGQPLRLAFDACTSPDVMRRWFRLGYLRRDRSVNPRVQIDGK